MRGLLALVTAHTIVQMAAAAGLPADDYRGGWETYGLIRVVCPQRDASIPTTPEPAS